MTHINPVMNYFAHLVLAQPTVESTVGNLLGDFARGVDRHKLPAAILAGLENHRAVDRYTDVNADIQHLKRKFSPSRRRFAGIALDVYFDHLLMKHWHRFESIPLQTVIDDFYHRIRQGQPLMPGSGMRQTTLRMAEHDWFGSYRDIASVADALDRIARRIRFKNNFTDSIEDISANAKEIESVFLQFFPMLKQHIQSLAIEN